MLFITKPHENMLHLLLETQQYQTQWTIHSRKLRQAFRKVTGLEFQQRTITAHVFNGRQSDAGAPNEPMMLAGDYRSEGFKLATIVHELSHRLLGGNVLGLVNLGMGTKDGGWTDAEIEFDHRHIYLFENDVMHAAFGEAGAELCIRYEGRYGYAKTDPHNRAWKWAMSFTFEERQRAMRWLAAKKVERMVWKTWMTKKPVHRDPITWFEYLEAVAKGRPL
jgi:hypothetical protein